MKRAGNLMADIADRENLLLAFWKAERGKRAQGETIRFREDLDAELGRLRSTLLEGPLSLGPYRSFTVHDPKERVICAAPFADRVLHHAVMNVCHASFEAYQVHDSYACRVNKGTHKAVARAGEFARRHRHYPNPSPAPQYGIGKQFDRFSVVDFSAARTGGSVGSDVCVLRSIMAPERRWPDGTETGGL